MKTDFIKLQVDNGGLNLTDISDKQKSLVLMWFLRTKKHPDLAGNNILNYFYDSVKHISRRNIRATNVPHVFIS